MAELINKITLSSGKSFYMPILSKHDGWIAQSNINFGTLYVGYFNPNTNSFNDIYAPFTQDEIKDICRMLTGSAGSMSDYPQNWHPPVLMNDSIFIYTLTICIYKKDDGSYEYRLPFHEGNLVYNINYNSDPDSGSTNYAYITPPSPGINQKRESFDIEAQKTQTLYNCTTKKITAVYNGDFVQQYTPFSAETVFNNLNDFISNNPDKMPILEGIDTDNPYAGTKDGFSMIGGGDINDIDPDEVEKTALPSLPSLSACNTGFITVYNPTVSELKALSTYLWNSNLFDVSTWQKLFADPMEGVIGLTMVPVTPTTSGSIPVMIGNAPTDVSMSIVSNQFVEVDCGSVSIDKYVNCFLDYIDTKINIYLPYIGMRELSAQDVMGDSIHVVYHVDVITGACACMIETSNKGVLYSFNGNCACDIPLNANNFSGAIQNAISAVISAAGVVGGAMSGAAPVTMASAAGLINSASNTAINTKPHVQKSGNMGGSSGLLSVQKPYVIIERPRVSVPESINKFVGNTSNITMKLKACHGFTMVEYIHLHDVYATSEEIIEIENLLKGGVII